MNETLQTIKARRSVRAYTEQQVSAEDLNLILEAATYAPSVVCIWRRGTLPPSRIRRCWKS